jgi:hypothetical protein
MRSPSEWEQPPLYAEPAATLARRLRDHPEAAAADLETPRDLLWYADLADALAQLYGHDAAAIGYDADRLQVDVDPPVAEPPPLRPRTDSVSLAVAGAAQLVSFGARPPQRCRTWGALVNGLLADVAVVEALTGTFPVPSPLASLHGAVVPGTRARLELARDPRQLAEWSNYMGNCIAGSWYIDEAAAGRCVLAALRDEDGRILANVELRPDARGWQVDEILARFNDDPDPALQQAFSDWVAGIRAARRPARRPAPGRHRPGAGRSTTRRTAVRLMRDVAEPLNRLAEQALADSATVAAAAVLSALTERLPRGAPGRPAGCAEPVAGSLVVPVALRRAGLEPLAAACRQALADAADGMPGAPTLTALWAATGVRPLRTALAGLDPDLRARFDHLDLLLGDTLLPGSLRRLAQWPALASARWMDLVARRVRTAAGQLAYDGDPTAARAVAQHPTTPMLCALALAVTSRRGAGGPVAAVTPVAAPHVRTIPGFPASTLDDEAGPWRRAWPAACELGAADAAFADQIAAGGLVVPAAWLGTGGWPALWSRAARNTAARSLR